MGVSAFPEKSVTKVYDSTLLALRGGGWGVTFPGKKALGYVTLEWPHRYETFCNKLIFDDSLHPKSALKSQVGLLQTGHSWANAGVLLGGRVRRRVAFD